MPKDLNAEGVSVVFVDHFDRAVVLGLKKSVFCSGADRLHNQCQVEIPTWAWCAEAHQHLVGMVLHVPWQNNRYAEGHTCLGVARRFC